MKLIGFLASMTEEFNGQRLSKGLASLTIGVFLTGSMQMAYKNVVHPDKQDKTRLPVTWPLILHPLLSSFITDDSLRKENYDVTSARIKKS